MKEKKAQKLIDAIEEISISSFWAPNFIRFLDLKIFIRSEGSQSVTSHFQKSLDSCNCLKRPRKYSLINFYKRCVAMNYAHSIDQDTKQILFVQQFGFLNKNFRLVHLG